MSSRAPLFLLLAVSIGCTTTTPSSGQGSNLTPRPPCRVTLPNRNKPPGTGSAESPGSHGNGKLWTVFPANGKLLITPDKDGRLQEKFPWWRAVRGRLTIRGRRLDAPADPLKAWIPGGYGETGFQATGIIFPSEGCWEITGRVGDSELTFVVEVRVR